jgi:3-oxoacyl-[acyl-carrier protein] reductase
MQRFTDKVVVVTGAAQGMGRSHAERFAAEGAAVVLVDRNEELVGKVAAGLPRALAVTADVTKAGDLAAIVSQAEETFGGVDVLVSNAGGALFPGVGLMDFDEERWDAVHALNLKAAWLGAQAVVASMRRRGGGSIVNIASTSVFLGDAGVGAYAAAKAGVVTLTRAMARELGPEGIRVNAVAPGLIKIAEPKPSYTPEEFERFAAQFVERQQIKRIGVPDDVSSAVLFLAAPEAGFITGQLLVVDGGAVFH